MSKTKLEKITFNPMLNVKYNVPFAKRLVPSLNFFNEIEWVYKYVPHTSYSIPSEKSPINEYSFFKSLNYDIQFQQNIENLNIEFY